MVEPRRRRRLALITACALYTAVVVPIGIHRGGDVVTEMQLSVWLMTGEPLYPAPPDWGAYWPPFAIFGLVPFALLAYLNLPLAKGMWAALNVAALGWSVARAGERWGWRPALIGLAAVGAPLQGNFQHLNINVLLAALVVAAAADLDEGREQRAGLWVGLATALKAFPGLLLLYLAYRRRWRAFAVGAGAAAGLTYLALLRYGPVDAVREFWNWIDTSRGNRRVAGFSAQPLGGLITGLGGDQIAVLVGAAACLVVTLVLFARRPREGADPVYELGAVTIIALLLAPVAQFHGWVLAYPAWVAVLTLPPPPGREHAWRAALVVAGLLLSGVLTHGLYPAALALVRRYNYVWGGLVLLGAMLARYATVGSLRKGGGGLAAPHSSALSQCED
jgi:glycosyl transferase family 87